MNAPLPVILAFAVLIGWPLIQIASVLYVRPKRKRMHSLIRELKNDPQYSMGEEQRAVVYAVQEAKGDPIFIVFPIVIPLVALACAIGQLIGMHRGRLPFPGSPEHPDLGRGMLKLEKDILQRETGLPTDSGLWNDSRFIEVRELANSIAFERWPVSSGLTLVTSVIVYPIFLAARGAGARLNRAWMSNLAQIFRWAASRT